MVCPGGRVKCNLRSGPATAWRKPAGDDREKCHVNCLYKSPKNIVMEPVIVHNAPHEEWVAAVARGAPEKFPIRHSPLRNASDPDPPMWRWMPLLQSMSRLLWWCRPFRLLQWTAFVVICAVVWVVLNYSTLQEYFRERDRLEHYRESVTHLQKQQNQLVEERTALLAGGFPAEKAIRERLLMVKPGEHVLFIETPQAARAVTGTTATAVTRP
jgi:cell division protein FtsB